MWLQLQLHLVAFTKHSKDKSGENIKILLALLEDIIQNIWQMENSEVGSKKNGTVFFKDRDFKTSSWEIRSFFQESALVWVKDYNYILY